MRWDGRDVEHPDRRAGSLGGPAGWETAHCRDSRASLVELFFSDDVATIDRAKSLCRGCPMAVPCLEGALQRQEAWGVWGGELVSAGRVVAVKRPRGRPRKHQPDRALAS